MAKGSHSTSVRLVVLPTVLYEITSIMIERNPVEQICTEKRFQEIKAARRSTSLHFIEEYIKFELVQLLLPFAQPTS
jgi:hypothetical protein